MFIIKRSKDLNVYLDKLRPAVRKIGFVPTMGALHKGHLSLLSAARNESGVVVCSIFVNPTQFNDTKDFELYPKTLENDIYLLEKAGCDVVFIPEVDEIYPSGTSVGDRYNLGYLETVLEGKYRAEHFQGVCQVVHRLLDIVRPHHLYLGQKDYQQCMVIKKMLTLTHLTVEVMVCPTLRETNGLAMSSRNMRLSDAEKEKAGGIFKALSYIARHIKPGLVSNILAEAGNILQKSGLTMEYLQIAKAESLELIDEWDGQTKIIALVAAYMGKVRLIDNMILPLNFAAYGN